MIKSTNWLVIAGMTMTFSVAFGQTRYVSTAGSDATNDCTLPGNPCATIEHAAAESLPGETIEIAAGTYNLSTSLDLNKSDVELSAQNPADKPVITSSVSDVVIISATGISVNNLRFEMGLTATSGLRGIVSTSTFDNLSLDGNEFISTKANAVPIEMVFGSYAVSLNSPFGTTQNVSFTNNSVSTLSGSYDMFGRGFSIGSNMGDGPGGTISNNEILAYYPIQAVRTAADLSIDDNILSGIIMLNSPVNSASISLTNNTIDAVNQIMADYLYSLLDIRAIETGSVLVADNQIVNYTTIGLLSMASQNVAVNGNTFTPLAGANNFVSLMANSKLMTNGVQGNTFSDQIVIEGNIFSAGAALSGTAIVFADHYGVNTPAFNANTSIGGPLASQKNSFDTNLGTYIKLDDQTGPSTTVALWAPYPATTMQKFSQDINAFAVYNNYGLMTFTEIEEKNYDQVLDPGLGKVRLFEDGTNRYVAENGSDVVNACTLPGNPCATIAYANSMANYNDSIIVAGGDYVISSTVSIDNDGVVLTAQDLTNKPVITSTASSIIEIDATEVEIKGLVFKMGLTAADGLKGITSSANYNNAVITENEFVSTKALSTGLSFGAFAISLNSVAGAAVDTVTITDNVVTTETSANDYFGRGINIGLNGFQGPSATVSGNDVTAFYAIQAVLNAGDVVINDNTLNGITMINAPMTGTNFLIEENEFNGGSETESYNLYSLVDVRAIDLGSVDLVNNLFADYLHLGLLSMASKNVTVDGNTFEPLATAEDFVSIMANTKLMTNGTQGNTYSDEISIIGNTFEAGVADKGTAIMFADHYGVNTPAFATGIVVGGALAAEKNTFATDLGVFIQLDSLEGASNTVELWAPYSVTTMKPFSQNVEALIDNNNYGSTDLNAIELMNIDSLDNNDLGKVILSYTTSIGLEELTTVIASIYPNPASDNLTISIAGKAKVAQVELIDLLGNVVLKSEMNSVKTLNIASLNTGVYIVKLTIDGKQYTSRVVKK